MARFDTGDRVQVHVPSNNDPDHRHHGCRGEVVAVFEGGAKQTVGHASDPTICRVKLEVGRTWDFFWFDLCPVPNVGDL